MTCQVMTLNSKIGSVHVDLGVAMAYICALEEELAIHVCLFNRNCTEF